MAEQSVADLVTAAAQSFKIDKSMEHTGSLASAAFAGNMRTMKKLAETGQRIESTESAINDAMVKRASILERIALAREKNDTKSEFLMRKQLENLDGQLALIKSVNELEIKQNKLFEARRRHQTILAEAQQRGHQITEKMTDKVRENLEDIVKISDEYREQKRTLQMVAAGVMDVKEAHKKVADEIEREQTAIAAREKLASMSRAGRLDTKLTEHFGEGYENLKRDLQGKAALFLKVGAAAGFVGSALRDMSHDSDEVVNTLYRMGGSMDRVNHGFYYYASNVLKLNQVQTQLRGTAAAMNMPVEAVEGMTDQIMQQIRVLDKYGAINLKTVSGIANTALVYSRQMGVDAKEALNLMSTLSNKFGYDPTKMIRPGVSELDDQMRGVTASVIAANDQLDDMGKGKANIFIEDVAKMMEEAANNSDGFSLSLKSLGATASQQMLIAKEMGASYNNALEQAKMLTDFMVKRNDLVNYKSGKAMVSQIKSQHADLIKSRDIVGLTQAIMADYGVKDQNEAALVARNVVSGAAMTNVTTGRILGGTEKGQRVVSDLLEEQIKKRVAETADTTTLSSKNFAATAATMGLDIGTDEKADLLVNSWLQKAIQEKQKGGVQGLMGSHFIGGTELTESAQAKKAYEQASREQVEKASPITPTSLKNTLLAVVESPFNKLILGGVAMVSAIGTQVAATTIAGAKQVGVLQEIKTLMLTKGELNGKPITAETLGGAAEEVTKAGKTAREAEAAAAAQGAKGLKGSLMRGYQWFKGNKTRSAIYVAAGLGLAYGAKAIWDRTHAREEGLGADERNKLLDEKNAATTSPERKAQIQAQLDASDRAEAEAARRSNDASAMQAPPKSDAMSLGNAAETMAIPALSTAAIVAFKSRGNGLGLTKNLAGPALTATATEGWGAGLKAGRNAFNLIPGVGGLLSAVGTAAGTEGSWGRKGFAVAGDLVGAELGQFLGPLGAVAGGYAGGKGGAALYDALWGDSDSKLATATVPPATGTGGTLNTPVPQSGNPSMSGYGGQQVLPADIAIRGRTVMLSIPTASFGAVNTVLANATTARETGISGIPRGGY